jgi:ABC-type transport system involved in multi-copper enzyme maturation permease subunit
MTLETKPNAESPPPSGTRMYWFLIPPAVVLVIVVSALYGAFEIAILMGLLALFVLLIGYGRDGWAPGPLYFYDVLRLARRGRGAVLRCVYGVSLLIGLSLLYANKFSAYNAFSWSSESGPRMTLPELARFAEDFTLVVALLQSTAVILLTPAYLAGAIAEEKERKTLELLFTTHLTDRQIVLGKMLARLTHLVGVLLTGLPILSLTQLFGGVSAELLFCHFIVAGLTLLSVGSVSILCSVQAKTVLGAMISSYAVVIGLNLGCLCPPCFVFVSPFGFGYAQQHEMFPPTGLLANLEHTHLPFLIPYAVVHGGIALFCLVPAVRSLRREAGLEVSRTRLPAPPRPPPPPPKPPPERVSTPPRRRTTRVHLGGTPPVTERPLLWKEMYHGASGVGSQLVTSLVTVGFLGFIVMVGAGLLANLVNGLRSFLDVLNPSLRVMVCVLSTALCLCVGFHAAGSVVRERAQKTLQSLLLLPVERWEILYAKWLGSILSMRYIGYFLIVVILIGLCTGAFHPAAVVMLSLACAVHVAFAAVIGLTLSVYCRSALAANFLMALFFFVWYVGSGILVAGTLPDWRGDTRGPVLHLVHMSVNPARTCWALGYSSEAFSKSRTRLRDDGAAIIGLLIYAGLGWVCWSSSCSMLTPRRPRLREALPDS